MTTKEQAIAYANWRGHTRDLMESDEEYDMFIQSMDQIFYNLRTMPVNQAFEYAEKDGWIWKHYKVVLEFLLS